MKKIKTSFKTGTTPFKEEELALTAPFKEKEEELALTAPFKEEEPALWIIHYLSIASIKTSAKQQKKVL